MELDTTLCSYHHINHTNIKNNCFIIDETLKQIDNKHFWLWIYIEPVHKSVLGIHISKSRNMIILSLFLESLLDKFDRHLVYSGGVTWHPEACKVLGLKHYLHSPLEKSMIEGSTRVSRIILSFDHYYPVSECI